MRMSSLKGKEEASDPCILIDGACDEDGNLYVASICGVQLVSRETGEQKVLDFLPVASYFSVCFLKRDSYPAISKSLKRHIIFIFNLRWG